MSGWEPEYNPDRYNKNHALQVVHNCYSFSQNVVDPEQLLQCKGKDATCKKKYHQPGGTVGKAHHLRYDNGRTCKTVEGLMMEDIPDLKPTTFHAKCPTGYSKIGLVVDPGDDYHYYRQDADGLWSHKDGANKVKRFDAEGVQVWDPKTAARDYRPRGSFLNYTDFCGYYCTPRNRTVKLSRAQTGGLRSGSSIPARNGVNIFGSRSGSRRRRR